MTPTDLRILSTALGFTAVVLQNKKSPDKNRASRALALASLIEEFCRVSFPDVFPAADKERQDLSKFTVAEKMATAIAQIIARKGSCQPQDLTEEGFSLDEIERYWAMAKALAYVERKIMDA